MSHKENDKAYDNLQDWVVSYGKEIGDIKKDSKGKYYILVDEQGVIENVYVPKLLQVVCDGLKL